MYSTSEEINLGNRYAFQIEKQLQLIYDPFINDYINNLGQPLVRVSKRNNIKYTFKVVNDPAINAFAIPGGHCYVNLGLIDFAETESELASVIGHEIGHYKKGHYGIRIENLVYIKKINKKLNFENLTLAPIEKDLINFDLLTHKEKNYLFQYHL